MTQDTALLFAIPITLAISTGVFLLVCGGYAVWAKWTGKR